MFEKLGNLSGFSRASLTDNNCHWECLDEIEQVIVMFGDGEKRRRFMKGRDEARAKIEVCHGQSLKNLVISCHTLLRTIPRFCHREDSLKGVP